MANFEEIRDRFKQRLEELLEESTRLRAALEALGGDDPPVRSGLQPGHTTKPVVKALSRDRPVTPNRGSAVTRAEPNAVNGKGDMRDPPVERAVRQLRQELAAGLRNGSDPRPRRPLRITLAHSNGCACAQKAPVGAFSYSTEPTSVRKEEAASLWRRRGSDRAAASSSSGS